MKNFFSALISFFKSHLLATILFFVFSAVFAVIMYLYNIPVYAVGYASIICASIGFICLVISFALFYKRHRLLQELESKITISDDELPEPRNIIEYDYDRLVRAVFREKRHIDSEAVIARSEMEDYYTMWAHQIKTPISAMRLILQSEDTEQSKILEDELFKISQYVEMVLQYLRLESISSDYVLCTCSLDKIIRQAIRKYANLFINRKISLKYDGTDMKVLTDKKWLQFVIEQLLSNSLKYTVKGTISIYVLNEKLVVEDTGIGIQEEDLPRVFDKGFTGCNGRTNRKSTGIGLYLCKKIIKKLSHTIEIESIVDEGTKVSIGFDTVDISLE